MIACTVQLKPHIKPKEKEREREREKTPKSPRIG
jgi:hypothetical protein